MLPSKPFFQVFMVDKWVCSAHNAEPLHSLPPESETAGPRELDQLGSPQWSSNAYPFLGFIPHPPRWDIPFLNQFSVDYHSVPLERHGLRYRLAEATRNKWSRFEEALQVVVNALLQGIATTLPLGFAFFPYPSEFGYLRSHLCESAARGCAI